MPGHATNLGQHLMEICSTKLNIALAWIRLTGKYKFIPVIWTRGSVSHLELAKFKILKEIVCLLPQTENRL